MVSKGRIIMKNKQYVVIIGWDDFAKDVVVQILNVGKYVIIVSDNKNTVDAIDKHYCKEQVKAIFTDYYNFTEIKKIDPENALAVLINLKDDTEKLTFTINLKRHFTLNKLIIPINNPSLKDTFIHAGVRYPISKDELTAKMVSSYLFEYDVALYCEDLLASAADDNDYDIQQYKVLQGNPYSGKDYGSAFKELKIKYNIILIGLSKYGVKGRVLLKNPPDNTKIENGDYLLLILKGRHTKELNYLFNIEEGIII